MIDGILDKVIDKALADVGMDDLDHAGRVGLRAIIKLATGLVMARAAGSLTLAHAEIASGVVRDMLEIAPLPEEKRPELREKLLEVVVKSWRDYAQGEDAENDKH